MAHAMSRHPGAAVALALASLLGGACEDEATGPPEDRTELVATASAVVYSSG